MAEDNLIRVGRCLSCEGHYPFATGVCTHCGAPPIRHASSGVGYEVLVSDIASRQQRDELAHRLSQVLDCGGGPDALASSFAAGRTILCSGLDRESADALVEYLDKAHVSARAEVSGASSGGGDITALIIGSTIVLGGFVALGVMEGLLRKLFGVALLIAGGVAVTVALIRRAYRPRGPICRAALPGSVLPGWESISVALSRLMVGLPSAAREALSQVATDVAFMQRELHTESIAAYASGGPVGPVGEEARELLKEAVARARAIGAERSDEEDAVADLEVLAERAARARSKLAALGSEPGAR